ncbi:MAG: hypothetical protein IKJ93_01710 [Clostridia bacterium]|nr:hypothetical protein [Clostridia bacterium]
MRNETLSHVLRSLNLDRCTHIKENIYYIKKTVRELTYSQTLGRDKIGSTKCEFLIIADGGVKKAIILKCGNVDLHWYVFKAWRNKKVLSNALRTNIIKETWSEIETVTCCYEYGENKEEKYEMTKHLAALAGLGISDEKSCWINF